MLFDVFWWAFVLFNVLKRLAIRYKTTWRYVIFWKKFCSFAILLDIQNVLWYTVNHKLIEIEQKIPLYHQLMTSKAILNCVLCFVGLHVSWNLVWPTSADNIKKLIYGQKLTQFDLKMQYNTVLSELKWLALQLCPKFGGLVWKRTLRKPISRIRLLWRITKRDKIKKFWTFLIVTLLFDIICGILYK